MVVHVYNPYSWAVEARGSQTQGHSQLCSEFKVSLGYRRPYAPNIYIMDQIDSSVIITCTVFLVPVTYSLPPSSSRVSNAFSDLDIDFHTYSCARAHTHHRERQINVIKLIYINIRTNKNLISAPHIHVCICMTCNKQTCAKNKVSSY